jgi:hypothetical protein
VSAKKELVVEKTIILSVNNAKKNGGLNYLIIINGTKQKERISSKFLDEEILSQVTLEQKRR